tara:strand:+ start:377 stop:3049 length:2673 start_codon:yes stop_codon:yes gene_type:complete
MMTSAQIRESFLDFFERKGHTIVPSASLMPSSPNLLFNNAGMNQFVPYFLGERNSPHPRIVDTQKCIRAGGKHNDLEDVGFDGYHHTFFEMLGNWSFGDYFKQEAIEWAWELLVHVWHFPKERLYATVYKPEEGDPSEFDQESYDIWKTIFKREGMNPEVHIHFSGKKDNFWMMGDTGPCGPCTEIHIDLTEDNATGGKLVNQDSPWCIELWNLVFIQLNAKQDGKYEELPAKHVDTGLGLERVAGTLATTQGFKDFSTIVSTYNSDLFTDIFKNITELSGHTYGGRFPESRNRKAMTKNVMNDTIFRVLADHIRTLVFSIGDNILPGNEGRNYVLRRILRRAVLFGKRLDLKPGFFVQLVDPLINKMRDIFPELDRRREIIRRVIDSEEKAFERTLDRGLQLLEDYFAKSQNNELSGEAAFTLYDTYGFPVDLTQIMAEERGFTVDLQGFEVAMEAQRERARASQQKTVIEVSEGTSGETTTFVGYDRNQLEHFQTKLVNTIESDGKYYLITEATPFYAEMGGQLGDHGTATVGNETFVIVNTVKDPSGHILHEIERPIQKITQGEKVTLSVDLNRRRAIERNHSVTHLLHWALRKVLGDHVEQAGSLVAPDHLRFDFTHFEGLSSGQTSEIEHLVNEQILINAEVQWKDVPFNEKPDDVIAFFGEKYGKVVRVVDIGGFSKELCGGTHVYSTGEIGLFKILSETAISAGTRRIEAVSGSGAYKLAQQTFSELHGLARKLSCKPEELENRLSALIDQRSELEKELKRLNQKGAAALADELANKTQEKDGLSWVIEPVTVSSSNDLKPLAMQVFKKLDKGGVVLGASFEDKVTVLALCSQEAIDAGHKAGDIIRKVCTELGGKGGGKPDFAMGGGKDIEKLPEALKQALN